MRGLGVLNRSNVDDLAERLPSGEYIKLFAPDGRDDDELPEQNRWSLACSRPYTNLSQARLTTVNQSLPILSKRITHSNPTYHSIR